MGLVDALKKQALGLGGKAMERVFADERRAEQVGELFMMVQRGRKAVDAAQEAALRGLGVASSGDLKATGKRLAQLRRTARQLDEKLSRLADRLDEDGDGSHQVAG